MRVEMAMSRGFTGSGIPGGGGIGGNGIPGGGGISVPFFFYLAPQYPPHIRWTVTLLRTLS